MKTSLLVLALAAFIVAPIPTSAAATRKAMTMPDFTKGDTVANSFYDASCETHRLSKDLKTDYGVTGTGDAGDSEKLQKAIDDVSGHGGGVVRIPAGNYTFKRVSLKSNVHLEIEHDVVIEPSIESGTGNGEKAQGESFAIFNLSGDSAREPIENVSIRGVGGRYTVKFPVYEPGVIFCSFKYVRNFWVSDANIEKHLTKFACFQFVCDLQSKDGVWRPMKGVIADSNVTGAAYGYGLVQIQAGESVLFENLSGVGGVTLRMETGAKQMNDAQIGGIDRIYGKNIECADGNAAVMISPHSMHNGVVAVDGVKSIGCGFGVRIEGGYIATKYSNPDLTAGTFAPGCYVKNVDATFGMNAQLKQKHYGYMPPELVEFIKTESEDGESHRGPSIAAVVNAATNFKVDVENVTAHGFKYQKTDVLTGEGKKKK